MTQSIAIAVQNPYPVAKALVKIWQGHCIPFPFLPNSYVVMPQDPTQTAIEIFPSDTELVLAETEETLAAFYGMLANRTPAPHKPIGVPTTLEQIKQIAQSAGWPVQSDPRPFSGNVQVWIEDTVMLELLPTQVVQSTRVASPSVCTFTLSHNLPPIDVEVTHMTRICDIAYQALTTGCLTIAAEEQLRVLMRSKYGAEDLSAFLQLQKAAMEGLVRQESREVSRCLANIAS